MPGRSLIAVIDDDESMRESLPDLLGELGFRSEVFASAEDFLLSGCFEKAHCLILDIAMPGMTGPELQRELLQRKKTLPIVFITAYASEALRPRLMEDGAVECLQKPFSDMALLGALEAALRLN